MAKINNILIQSQIQSIKINDFTNFMAFKYVMMIRKFILCLLGCLAVITVSAQQKIIDGDSIVIVEAVLKKMNKNMNFVIVPGPAYNSSSNLGFAILPMFTYNLNKKDTLSPPSSTSALIYFDLIGSWFLAARQNLYFNENKWRMISSIGYGDLRTKFFGIGRDTAVVKNNQYVYINQKTFLFMLNGYRRVFSNFYAGLEYSYLNVDLERDDSSSAAEEKKDGLETGHHIESQLSPSFIWDSRDDIFWSSKGFFSTINLHLANHLLFGDHDYFLINAFINGYHCLLPSSKKLILAWRIYFQGSWGNVPYYQLADYSKGDGYRGYTPGKYVNRSEVNAQVELRYDVWKFICITGFMGTGKIFKDISSFGQSIWLPSGGVGLYLTLIASRNIRMGMNFAVSRHDYGIYVGLNQAF